MPIPASLPILQKQEWLEPLEEGLQKGLKAVFAPDSKIGKPVENALHGVFLGHSLHPAIVGIPIGAWTVACVLDIAEDITGVRNLRHGSDWAVATGLMGAAGAAVTGLTDWKDTDGPPRRTGLVHALLNVTSTALYIASIVQRGRGKRTAGRSLSYAGFGIAMVSSWIGGHLVSADNIGVEHKAVAPPPENFVPVAALTDLEEGKPHRVVHEEYPIVLVKEGQRVYALAEVCSHLGGPLAQGTVENGCIRCPWHGSLFRLDDGRVVESPATRPQAAFEARIVNGQIEVKVIGS